MLTRHSTTVPSSFVIARISLTHALLTFFSVFDAFFNPPLTASSMLLSDDAEISMTLATLFIAQALGFDLSLEQQLTILVVAMLTSKGASGVTGAGFVTQAATLSVVPSIPVAGMALIFGVDKFMSECRALTNIIGNGVATVVISAWERELDRTKLASALHPRADIGADLIPAASGE